MKTKLIFVCTGLSLAIILNQFGFFNALLLLLLVGAIPGTSFSISPLLMLAILVILAGYVTFRFSRPIELPVKAKKAAARKRLSQV